MIAVIAYDLDFDVDHVSNYANIYADVSIDAVYFFDSREQAMEYRNEIREWHPGKKLAAKEAKQPAVEKAEMDKYQMWMEGDWS
jgi:hypothetical protein